MSHTSALKASWLPLGLLVSTAAVSQASAAGPPRAAPPDVVIAAPLFDPAQLPSFSGKVQQFTLSSRGEIDGLILSDGTEVKTPPHLSTSIAYAIKPGDSVTIHGLHAAAMPLLQATSITDHASGRTIIDTESGPGPAGPRRLSVAEAADLVEVQGSIRMSLHGARGEINGVLLTDGTVLRLPPDVASSMDTFLQPGRNVVAQGEDVSNPIGRVLEVRAIGASRAALLPIEGPPTAPRSEAEL